MKNKIKIEYFVYMMLIVVGCEQKEPLYKGQYKGQAVTIDIETNTTFTSRQIDYFIKLGDLNPVSLNAHTVDLYGRPYSYTIFKNIPYHLIGPDTITYKNRIDNEQISTTMLYIDPQQHDLKSYQAYADFFVKKWPKIEQELHQLKNIYFGTHLIGVVYARRDHFVRYFTGQSNGNPYYFEISPDGVINYQQGIPENNDLNLQNSGLAEKVEMPGEIIRITDTLSCSKDILRQFKDRHGKSMEDYFRIEL
ncbi:hypothetical protein ABIE26_002268 [Pedobacter africanus]|uniref:Uncharacterized protein n=1 Tax=Pedobacter africanus TaxID=151894 RepID=A0ACC6KYY7_9SPHI|nr:hypothetical protein [Pedobacter africanus]MDR6784343.1 hypothetical protein [Pedobacter africanus]